MDWATKQRVMRALRGLSQLDLATVTEIPNTYLSAFETGRSLPPEGWERDIKSALGWPAEWLAEIAFGILDGSITFIEGYLYERDSDRAKTIEAPVRSGPLVVDSSG